MHFKKLNETRNRTRRYMATGWLEREREGEKSKLYLNKMLISRHVLSTKDLSLVYKLKQT